MKNMQALLVGCAASLATAGTAQMTTPRSTSTVLRGGTEVPMKTVRRISSLHARQGERFDLEVTQDVLTSGRVAIPKGSRGIGEVRRVVSKGMMGKSGKLEVQVLFVEVGGRRIRVDGLAADRGKAGTIGVVGAALLAGAFGGFVTGTSAVIPAGTEISGYVFKDVQLDVAR